MKLRSLLIISILFAACSKQPPIASKLATNIYYDKAFEYREDEKADSAFKYFNKAKDVFLEQNDSLGVAKCLANMGLISTLKGDYFGSQDLSLKALTYFNEKIETQFVHIKANYNNLGKATYLLKDYKASIKFYDLAILFSRNPLDTRVYLNNKAKTYQEIKNYQEALKIYSQALAGVNKGSIEYARTLTNISLTKWLQDPSYNVLPDYLEALNIRKKKNDLWGLNSSYAHLADYYSYKNVDSTLMYAHKMYLVAKRITSPEDQLQALRTLIRYGPSKEAKQHFDVYLKLRDSLQDARTASRNQFALIRYNIEKKEADNLLLQKDNTEKKYQIIKREILFVITLLILIAASIIAILWYKKRKQKLELESQNTIRENQLRTSKKVHDVVANGLYRVMTEIENREGIDKEHILDKIDDMYQKSRDISYDKPQTTNSHFSDKLTKLLLAFETETIKVVALGNTVELWEKVTPQVKYEIEHILQELMVNMDKHSQATEVSIKFYKKDKFISIHYNDNGTGLSENVIYNNGLTNTETRIKNISGTITFETIQNKGLVILISFPIH